MNNLNKIPENANQAFEMLKDAWRAEDLEEVQRLICFLERPDFKEESEKLLQKIFPGIQPTGFNEDGSYIYSMNDLANSVGLKPDIIIEIAGKIPNPGCNPKADSKKIVMHQT